MFTKNSSSTPSIPKLLIVSILKYLYPLLSVIPEASELNTLSAFDDVDTVLPMLLSISSSLYSKTSSPFLYLS